jgi:hypothetical protein
MCIYYIIQIHYTTDNVGRNSKKNTNATRVRLGIRNDEKPVYTDWVE